MADRSNLPAADHTRAGRYPDPARSWSARWARSIRLWSASPGR